MGLPADAVRDPDRLFRAWRAVRTQLLRSDWPELRREAAAWDARPLARLNELAAELESGVFRFAPRPGYVKRKSGGSRRGITVPAIRERIVQRSILDVLYAETPPLATQLGELPAALRHPCSFAGTPGRGVPEAIARVVAALRAGAGGYAYSDLKDCFPCVPRRAVTEYVRSETRDDAFADLFAAALETELANPDELAPWLDLFPGPDRGVAQGSLLSVAATNLALREFDRQAASAGCELVRYLDDFLLLGPTVDAAQAAFATARAALARQGMTCYEPGDGSQKAAWGDVREGFDFLGCRVHPDGTSPARRNARRLVREIEVLLVEGRRRIDAFVRAPDRRRDTESTYVQTLHAVDRKLRGWGAAYRFVTNRVVFAQLDRRVDRLLADFHAWFARRLRDCSPAVARRVRGVTRLGDVPPEPS